MIAEYYYSERCSKCVGLLKPVQQRLPACEIRNVGVDAEAAADYDFLVEASNVLPSLVFRNDDEVVEVFAGWKAVRKHLRSLREAENASGGQDASA